MAGNSFGQPDDLYELDPHVYYEGAKRWFTLFYNSTTGKFINYFEKLIQSEKRISLRFPQDISDGSYSTAYASGVTPQDLVMPLAPSNDFLRDNHHGPAAQVSTTANSSIRGDFDIWGCKPEIVVHRQCAWKISHMPSLQDVSPSEYVFISKSESDH